MQQTANLHQFLAAGFDPKSIARAASAITVQGAIPSGSKQRPAAKAERAGSEPCAVHRGAARVAKHDFVLSYARHREKLERLASEAGGSAQGTCFRRDPGGASIFGGFALATGYQGIVHIRKMGKRVRP